MKISQFQEQNCSVSNTNFKILIQKRIKEGEQKHLFGVEGDSERRVKASSDGGIGGVLVTVGDVAYLMVDANTGYRAIDLESGLEIEDGAVYGEVHDDHSRRRRRPR